MPILPPVAPAVSPRFTFNGNTPQFQPAPAPREQFAITPLSALIALGESCSRAEILTFTALAAHADHEGHCWPGRERLASLTGLNPSRVSKATSGLERKGFLRKEGNAGFRVEYYLLTPPIPAPKPAPPPDRNGTTPLTETAHRTDQGTYQEQREPTPEPARPEPTPQPQAAHSDFASHREQEPTPKAPVIPLPSKTVLPDDWQLPDDYRAWAEQHRPDLAGQMDSIASKFHDFHLSKATRSACWIAEWRRWINRERAVKPPQNGQQATQSTNRYSSPDSKETPISAAVKASFEASEQRRLDQLRAAGIDPLTGCRIAAPLAPAATGTLPDGEPLPAGRNETAAEYDRRFEQHRQYQLRRLQEMVEARAAKAGSDG